MSFCKIFIVKVYDFDPTLKSTLEEPPISFNFMSYFKCKENPKYFRIVNEFSPFFLKHRKDSSVTISPVVEDTVDFRLYYNSKLVTKKIFVVYL